jgi:hypothetical protein
MTTRGTRDAIRLLIVRRVVLLQAMCGIDGFVPAPYGNGGPRIMNNTV